MRDLDPLVWFGEREVTPVPRHFVATSVPVDNEILNWVHNNLKGRFSYGVRRDSIDSFDVTIHIDYFYFEDPAEATFFELRWAGK